MRLNARVATALLVRRASRPLLLILLLGAGAPVAGASGPLALRNLAPFSALYGIPRMRGVRHEQPAVAFQLEQVSHFSSSSAQSGASSTVIFQDGESSIATLDLRGGFAGLSLGAELPWIRHSGGSLDRFIDNFHRTFGLPEGGREDADRDQLDLLLRVDGRDEVSLQQSTRGMGDLRLWLGGSLSEARNRALAWRAQVKLPTGDPDELTGSGGTDVALWVEFEQRRLPLAVTVSAGLGGSYLGSGDLAADAQERWVPLGHLGLQRAFGRWHWSAQLDAHGPLFDLPVDQLGDQALLGSLGVSRTIAGQHHVRFAIVEDLISQSTSDVAFQLRWEWSGASVDR